MKTLVSVFAFASLLWSCGQADPEALGQQSDTLYYATPSGPEDDAVLKLRAVKNDGSTLWCTASLIAPNLVLTAMHCVATVTDSANCTAEGELAAGSIDGIFGEPFVPSNITFHIGAGEDEPVAAIGEKIFTTGAITLCKDDAAVVALDRELTNVPVAALRLGVGNQRGQAIRLVGFGRTEDGSTGVRKTRDDLKIQLLGASVYSDSSDPIPPNTFGTTGVSVCNGDSGGPAFTTKNAVTGVVSHGASCDSTTARRIFTELAPYEDMLLKPAFAYAGHEPILEASDANGSAGAGGESGESGAIGEAGAATGAATNGAAGHGASDGADDYHEPPAKGGCACSSTASARSGSSDPKALLALMLFGVACVRRRRARAT
ncbi:MAG: S1 family peptidase [Pseudomonadota bacterium]